MGRVSGGQSSRHRHAVRFVGNWEETVIESFETDALGGPPRGWLLTMTGKGAPKWTVEREEGGGAVVKQSGKATYPVALKEGTNIRDGYVEVKFKPISGSEDRAGGIVWRARDANNYYVVRANALE